MKTVITVARSAVVITILSLNFQLFDKAQIRADVSDIAVNIQLGFTVNDTL